MPNRIIVALALTATVLAACPNDFGGVGPGDTSNTPPDDPYWCCDPDELAGCTCLGYWHCTESQNGGKHCVQQNPTLPDDGGETGWNCQYQDELIVCTGESSDHPDAGQDGGWNCETVADLTTCTRESEEGDFPDGVGEAGTDCVYSEGGDARVCDSPSDTNPDDGWDCETGADGVTICRNTNPEQPDDGEGWDCYRVTQGGEEQDVCVGDHMPDGGGAGEWDCQENGELVQCENQEGQVPDGGGGGAWECDWGQGGEGLIVCEGEGGGGEVNGGCSCIEGAHRYCDEPTFCNWGTQTCETRNGAQRWTACNETQILSGCQPGGADAEDYEWHYRGGFWDGQVNDPNGDGIILMPPDNWYNPAAEDCALRKGYCVQDMWDLDNDDDNQESTGDCADIQECV